MESEDRYIILGTLKQRYEFDNINQTLLEELDWVKSVRNLLLEEAERKKGKVSGYCLKLSTEHNLNNEVIQKLEAKSPEVK